MQCITHDIQNTFAGKYHFENDNVHLEPGMVVSKQQILMFDHSK